MGTQKPSKIPLPKVWKRQVRSAMLHVISLAQYATVYTRSWAVDSMNGRVRLKAENDRLIEEVARLREEMRIKDARPASIVPQRRPHYSPVERLAILELRAARGWSNQQAAAAFLVTAATIASWMQRVDEEGPHALVQLRQPVNKFPDFVRYAVQRLKVLCPSMGKVKIAQTLARAGLHLGATTVGRILKETPPPASPANRCPRIEPRKHWPRASRCARPQTLVAGQPGDRFTVDVDYHRGRKYLPIVTLQRAA